MSIAYFDCFAGISGDMILGSLIDAGGDRAVLDATVEALHLDGEIAIEIRREQRGHLGGTRVAVSATGRRERKIADLRAAVTDSSVPAEVQSSAIRAIDLLAGVESRLHNVPDSDLHLHELGGVDTLIDLVGAFWLLHAMNIKQVYASPLPTPRGRFGDMPLPAPASVRLLAGAGAVFEASDEAVELVTPTGAAVLAAAAVFERPAIKLHSIGYGLGGRETPGNALAVWVGDEVAAETGVTVIETNLDDMAPNLVAALAEDLMAAGAIDVSVTPAVMKKGRLGHLVAVMSAPDHVAVLTEHLLRHSTTLGVRLTPVRRVIAERRNVRVETALGTVRVKVKELGGKPVDAAPEYEDCRRIARASGRDLREVMRIAGEAARRQLGLA
jgi:uncharacterized protein (TIGR00299 family) protein